jgi:hypothetical protein
VEEKPKPKGLTLTLLLAAILSFSLLYFGIGLFPLWECRNCHNIKPYCPYCSGTGKQNLYDKLKYERGMRGGGWLQDR